MAPGISKAPGTTTRSDSAPFLLISRSAPASSASGFPSVSTWSAHLRLARGTAGDRLLADDLEAEALQADHALLAVGQQHHFLHADVDQDLGADAVVAQFAAGRLDALAGAAALLGQHDGDRLADQHDDAAAFLG